MDSLFQIFEVLDNFTDLFSEEGDVSSRRKEWVESGFRRLTTN